MNDYCELPTAQRIAAAREKLGLEHMPTHRWWHESLLTGAHKKIGEMRAFSGIADDDEWKLICPAPSCGESIAALGDRFGSLTRNSNASTGVCEYRASTALAGYMCADTPAEAVGLLLAEVYEAQVKEAK